jgi:hypothetical protein
MGDYDPIVMILVILLAPGIPAYILYSRLPPERTIVKGPFKGFQLDLTGAFAAYFLLVIVSISFIVTFMSKRRQWYEERAQFETWVVNGKLEGEDSAAPLTDASITFSPRLVEIRSDGSFFTVVSLQTGGPGKSTTMQIEHPLYNTAVVHLSKRASPRGYGSPYKLDIDTVEHEINIMTPIVLKEPPKRYVDTLAYQPADTFAYQPQLDPDSGP